MAEAIIAQEVVRGSDFAFRLTWKDSEDVPLDFTGYTISFLDVAPSLEGRLSGSFVNAALGQLSISVEGNPPLTVGLHSFRVLLTYGTLTRSTKRLYLRVV
jgi:hypothetical protein